VGELYGFLNINKPPGQTSRWVVDQIQRLVRPAKVGHAGTLDPLATGVLVVAVGSATRLIDYVQQMPKRYRADFLLGCTSPTEDVDGDVVPLENPVVPTQAEIEAAIPAFLGEILQSPPAFSALKVGGRRAYSLARAGQAVELKPRPVSIHRLNVLGYEYPRLQLEIECSSGTYVRSLGRDLAEKLGTGAVMSALVRTAIGSFRVENSIDVSKVNRSNLADYQLPARRAVDHLPAIVLNTDDQQRIASGQPIACPAAIDASDTSEFAAVDDGGNLTGILCCRADGMLWPARNLSSS
jgi:tRNA pseudouridine55 synthase